MNGSVAEYRTSNYQGSDSLMRDRAGNGRLSMVGEALCVADLPAQERSEMFALFSEHFDGGERAQFEADLGEKTWVVMLRQESSGELLGFTSLMLVECVHRGQIRRAIYSGDTILRPDAWGSPLLMRLWLRFVFSRVESLADSLPIYWFLLCSGYKTFRFLPLLMNRYVPSTNRPEPNLTDLRNAFAGTKFPGGFNPEQGIVRLRHPTPLKAGIADLDAARLRDPQVAFFMKANPGHAAGDELACLAELSWANLTAAGRRLVDRRS